MDHNPYTPPQANTELTFQQEAAPRPISVWLLIFTLLALFMPMSTLLSGVTSNAAKK